MKIDYKEKNSFEKRLNDAENALKKFPDRVPIIVERRQFPSLNPFYKNKKDHVDLKNDKYLVPKDLTVGQFLSLIRKNLNLRADEALYLFINNNIPLFTSTLGSIYEVFFFLKIFNLKFSQRMDMIKTNFCMFFILKRKLLDELIKFN